MEYFFTDTGAELKKFTSLLIKLTSGKFVKRSSKAIISIPLMVQKHLTFTETEVVYACYEDKTI